MSISIVGGFFLALLVCSLFTAKSRIWQVVILALPFEAAAAITFGATGRSFGVAPGLLTLCLASVVTTLRMRLTSLWTIRPILWVVWPLIWFVVWALIATIAVPPVLGDGVRIFPFGRAETLQLAPLQPSLNGMTHAIYLVACTFCFFVLAVATARWRAIFPIAFRSFMIASWVVVFFLIWHLMALYLGVPFPSDLLHNNPSVGLSTEDARLRPELHIESAIRRPSGTFSESSFASMYIVAFGSLQIVWSYCCGRIVRAALLALLFVCLVALTTATTGYVTLAFLAAGALLFSISRVLKSRDAGVLFVTVTTGAVVLGMATTAVFMSESLMREAAFLLNFTLVQKFAFEATSSGGIIGRGVVEGHTLSVFLATYGLGAGLGGNLCYTLPGYVVSNTGAIGMASFGLYAWRMLGAIRAALSALPRHTVDGAAFRALLAFLCALLLCGTTSVALMFFPSLWIVAALLIGRSAAAQRQVNQIAQSARDSGRSHYMGPC